MESLRILWILLYKSWLIRKRHWIISLIVEILLPLGIVLLPWYLSGDILRPAKFMPDARYDKLSFRDLLNEYPIHDLLYAPNNFFVDQVMEEVKECFNNKTIREFKVFDTEADLIDYHRKRKSNDLAIIFDESSSVGSKHLHYKFRSNSWIINGLYSNYHRGILTASYTQAYPFVQTQMCVDKSFIKMRAVKGSIPEMFIQQMPEPAHFQIDDTEEYLRWMNIVFLSVAFMFPLLVETARATNEKFIGMNVLMSMNGISNTLNLLSWTISGFLLLSVFCVAPNLLLLITSSGNGLAFINYGDPLILFFTLALYAAHLLTFGVHLSAYFSKALLVTVVIMIMSVLPIILMIFVLKDGNFYLVPYVGIIFPNALLYQAVQEFRSYEVIGEGLGWSNFYTNTNPTTGIAGGVGMILLLFVIGIIFHFTLSIYVYAVKPGKYGVGKHPLFFMMFKGKQQTYDSVEDVECDYTRDARFEPTPPGSYTPGIQIRNLKKAYNIGLFRREKVEALRGVSVDFYKGQITSLLGHNGAGKTTMMSILTGMISPTDGLVLVNSKNLKDNASEIMNDMGLCSQENMYFSSLTVSEQLVFFAMVKRKDKSKSEIQQDVSNLLGKLKLFNKRNALPNTLSGGQKRRLCLGMALVGDSSILILDEPTSGLDPESRRVIWDILLKMRGQKTILISTHDMEEADILGDRIAIMHTGQLKSYGTSLFLKKMIGRNNVEVTLSIEPHSDPDRIRRELHREAIIVNKEASKIVVSIPNSADLPDSLDNLEEKKKTLGVSGFSLSLISLEQVFLKTTAENEKPVEFHHTVASNEAKLTNLTLRMQTIRALLSKKMTYALKDLSTILIQVFTVLIAFLLISVILQATTYIRDDNPEDIIEMNLDKYPNPEVFYTSDGQSMGDQYKSVSENHGGHLVKINNTNLENALLKRGKEDINHYEKSLIAAAAFEVMTNGSVVNAFYSEKATFSLPISINLVWNSILKNLLGADYSISLSSQKFPRERFFGGDALISYLNGLSTAIIFSFFFYYAIAMFVIHPLRESTTGVKQLQKMTGISGFTYWGTMFLFDLAIFVILIVIIVAGFACIDYSIGLRLFGSNEFRILVLLLILFAVNALPLVYIFSFLKSKANTVIRLLTYIPIGIVIFDLIMTSAAIGFEDDNSIQQWRSAQKAIFLLLPYESFLHTQIIFQMTAQINARCKAMPNQYYTSQCTSWNNDVCCNMGCYNGACKKYINFFTHSETSISSKDSLTYLYIMPIVYFIILALLESQLIQNIRSKLRNNFVEESIHDEQVRREKSLIRQKIKTLGEKDSIDASTENINNGQTLQSQYPSESSNDRMFLVYELQKIYKNVRAVEDVSFGVNRRECFGLLGVNGAGKSTAFRMMTGGEVADHGIMYLGDKHFENNKKYFLSQMGYCPQQDAILKCLNAYDHLRLFARLRGVPRNKIESEVEAWIERLNLSGCASQPSGTYSGGNKRRLNIAIALIGSPNLVLMDEPTTGVDPGARRSLWNVIKACQMTGQAVVLTSHSMEECEALCNRLAIMVDGKLVCIGPSEQLKQRFGAGYDIQIKINLAKTKNQLDSIKGNMPRMLSCVLTDENLGNLMYHVAPAGTTWRKMYDVMNAMKHKYDCIDDFLVLSSSLEQLFLLFARTANGHSRVSWLNDHKVL